MPSRQPLVTLVRHGETDWSKSGRHTSRTDLGLTPEGEREAIGLGRALRGAGFDLVLSSPMRRARQTAELAGLVPYEVDPELREWDYGDLEGRTTSDICSELPGWSIWDGPWPGGESVEEVAARADRVLWGLLRGDHGRVCLVSHGHFLRVLAARWVEADATFGRRLVLRTASVSELGWEKAARALLSWDAHVRLS